MDIATLYNIAAALCVVCMAVLTVIAVPVLGWQLIIGIRGLFKPRVPVKIQEGRHRFAVLVCARNEQQVIGNLLDSIAAQEYPRDLYEVFLVADNCDAQDRTAQIGREKGAVVLERRDTERVGKGYALSMAIDHIHQNHPGRFDAFMIFDADNLLARDFLQKMSDGLNSGLDIVSGYRDTKNPQDSWVSGCYDIYWTIVMRMFNGIRYSWGLSSMVHGTGFAVRAELLREGWKTDTVTEDGEFSVMARIAGHKIALIRDARFYDEQPTKVRHFFTQFHRWEVGGVQCFKKLWRPALLRCRENLADGLDLLAFLALPYGMAAMFLSFIPYLLLLAISGLLMKVLWILAASAAVGIFSVMILAVYGLAAEGKPVFRMWRSILLFPVFTLPMSVIAVGAVARPKVKWRAIPHESQVRVGELEARGEAAAAKTKIKP